MLLGAVSLALAACAAEPAPQLVYFPGDVQAVDGDTLAIGSQLVRLYGVDAFELRQYCEEYPCGEAARAYLDVLILGREVRCQTLAEVSPSPALCRIGNLDINDAMVRAGWALALRGESLAYVPAENQARRNYAGAWNLDFESPWEW